MIRRTGKRTALKIVLTVFVVLILAICAILYWQRDAFLLLLNPKQITLQDTQTVKSSVERGDYRNITTPSPETLQYQTQDEAFTFAVDFEGETVKTVSGQADITKLNPMSIQEGLALGETLLSPYLEKEQITAVETLLMSDILQLAASTTIDYSRDIGNFTITVNGSLDRNDLQFTLENNEG